MKVFYFSKKKMYITLAIVLVIVIVIILLSTMSEELASVFNTGKRKIPIYNVDTKEKVISISFDAAYGNEYTNDILSTLEKYEVKTTFFLVGFWVEKYPEDVKSIVEAGHELGNHSSTHPDMTKLNPEKITKEIEKTNEKLKEFTNADNILFRAPFGAYNNDVIEMANQLGCYTIQWDVDSIDWKNEGKEQIVNRVVSNVKPGSIVLFHNNAKYIVEALSVVLEELKEQGYSIVPISELIYKDNFYIDNAGCQHLKNE